MAVVNPNNYFGLDLSEMEKAMFKEAFLKEGVERGKGRMDLAIREQYADMYMTSTEINYLLSNEARATVDKIKLSNPIDVFEMIIEAADEGATILLGKDHYFRYYRIDDIGDDCLVCFWGERVFTGNEGVVDGKVIKDFYFNYETFRIMKDDWSHPDMLEKGLIPEIILFVKAIIFISCTNVEPYVMKPSQKARPVNMADKKWINKSGMEVTLINADWNRMYISTDGFDVQGHIRFQRHGKGNKEVKIIYINPYRKQGYQRKYHD